MEKAEDENRQAFHKRRAWFDAYYERFNVGIPFAPEYGVRFTCPCCGYPTLFERRRDEICPLCNWQNDGQDDPHADEVWGGPNKPYSLTEARHNFVHYGVKYSPDNNYRVRGPDSAVERAVKQETARALAMALTVLLIELAYGRRSVPILPSL